MSEMIYGWLFDIYPNETNLTLWLIGEDGKRHRFVQDFAATVYAAGPSPRLRKLWKWLKEQPVPVHLSRTERRDVFHGTFSAPLPTGMLRNGADEAASRGCVANGGSKPPRYSFVFDKKRGTNEYSLACSILLEGFFIIKSACSEDVVSRN